MEMNLNVDLGNLKNLHYVPDRMKPVFARAINEVCREIMETAQDKETHRFKSRTSALEKSISMRDAKPDHLSGEVYIDPLPTMIHEGKWAGFSYGFFVHEGTRPHAIIPKNKKMLKFVTTPNTAPPGSGHYGRFQKGMFTFAFAVWHPGAKQDQFIYKAAEQKQAFARQVFERAMETMTNNI